MLESVTIERFRGFANVKITPLSRINLVTGGNDFGKTGILEAIYFLLASGNQLAEFPQAFRNHQRQAPENFKHFWLWLFPERNVISGNVRVTAAGVNGLNMLATMTPSPQHPDLLEIQYVENGGMVAQSVVQAGGGGQISNTTGPVGRAWPRLATLPVGTRDPVIEADRYNQVVAKRLGEETMLKLMNVIEPRLLKIRYLKLTQEPLVYCDLGLELAIPVSQMGQAFNRLMALHTEMLTSKAKILLIDEIENGLSTAIMPEIWQGLSALAKEEDIQIIATTHSRECLKAAREAAYPDNDIGFSHHELQVTNGQVTIKTSPDI